mmetsp:Transcript_11198/g.69137  ORF Transcript_11198/g.69137 Transcript_11198/m.69137 type:complete len:260 (-) Transcript_11198:529-1308(-)|eukprot:CAMPEP_0183824408 /NCGR_PEP_ID=MMETSP0807_2-20130328/566_1 /TAXON_ID=88271 /ORGANISM="Picocystis salinarum, Strain CCMP1897" /LENGTH=259 /DNA_ID=CAMNT_0026069331 /DNA_START=488 /DNA_END=1267 /DNA_ORIENTATION=-
MNGRDRNFLSVNLLTHRRAASDSFVVLEESSLHQDFTGTPSSSNTGNSEDAEVVKLSGDQLITTLMETQLVGEVIVGSPTPGDSSNTKDGQKALEPSSLDPKDAEKTSQTDQDEDTKRVKRILANRQSAQRSRLRKLQYISDLEKNVQRLQEELHNFDARIDELQMKKQALLSENSKRVDELNMCIKESQYHEAIVADLRQKLSDLQHCGSAAAYTPGNIEPYNRWGTSFSNGMWETKGAHGQIPALSDIYSLLGDMPE